MPPIPPSQPPKRHDNANFLPDPVPGAALRRMHALVEYHFGQYGDPYGLPDEAFVRLWRHYEYLAADGHLSLM